MQLRSLTITAAMLLSMTSGIDSYAKLPAENAVTVKGNEIQGDLAEWELLKAYLSEVKHSSEQDIQNAQADYKLRKLIFKESSRRWWEAYREDQRQQKINDYWKRFFEGQDYAQSIVGNSVGNYCQLLSRVDLSPMKVSIQDENISAAFERGYKGAYPECSITNLDQFLRDTDKKISAIEKRLTSIRTEILLSKPNEKDTEVIYNGLKAKYIEVVKAHINVSKEKLEKSFAIPPTELKRFQESAAQLAQAIECSTLKSRAGTKYNCAIQVVEAPVKLGVASTYRVLKGEQETGAFQSQIYMGQLLTATAVYLREVNPNAEMVRYLANDLSVSLTKMQAESDKRIQDARKLIAEDFFTQMRTLRFDTIDLNRGAFSREVMLGVIKDLLDIKPAVESYIRLDISTQYEQEILEKILAHYRSTLSLAGSLKAEVKLPRREIIVTLEDEETSDVVTLDPMATPPTAYLLGVDQEEISEWMDILAL